MAKVEIEVPEGKVAAIAKNGDKVMVTFEDSFKRLKTINSVIRYLKASNEPWAKALLEEYDLALAGSYSEKVTLYRMVVAALTNNEERSLTTGECWCPVIEFGSHSNLQQYLGDNIVGEIESKGEQFTVVSGYVYYNAAMGIGSFNTNYAIGHSTSNSCFRSVSREDVAKHISEYFGPLLFEVAFGGTNCDWKWID